MLLHNLWLGAALLLAGIPAAVAPRPVPQTVFTDDVDHFWQAFDRVRATPDRARQVALMQRLYVDRGSEGLRAFMQARGYSAEEWVTQINKYPKFWASVRPNTLVRFDPATEQFQTWIIPAGGGVVRNMMPTRQGDLVLAESGVNRVALVTIDQGGGR